MKAPTLVVLALGASLLVGCLCKRGPVNRFCSNNAGLNLSRVQERYDRFVQNGLQRGTVYWSRHDLEVARFVLFKRGGIDGSGAACTPGDRKKCAWRRLRKRLKKMTRLVKRMERARGVKFRRIVRGRLIWTWLRTGQKIPSKTAPGI